MMGMKRRSGSNDIESGVRKYKTRAEQLKAAEAAALGGLATPAKPAPAAAPAKPAASYAEPTFSSAYGMDQKELGGPVIVSPPKNARERMMQDAATAQHFRKGADYLENSREGIRRRRGM